MLGAERIARSLAARRWSGVPFGRSIEIGEEQPERKRRHAKEQQQGQLVEAKGADDDIHEREQGVDGPNERGRVLLNSTVAPDVLASDLSLLANERSR